MLALVYATGTASHARWVKGDDNRQKGICWPSRLGIGYEANNNPQKKVLLINLKEMKLNGYLSNNTK
jgi:hypothetical protein